MSKNYHEKLHQLRALMDEEGVDVYLVPRADEYLGEFVAPYAERLAWLTGFTGSAGTAIITADSATVMSDGRYTIQMQAQIDPAVFQCEDSVKYPLPDWLYDHTQAGSVVGFDPALYSIDAVEKIRTRLTAKDGICRPVEDNLIDRLWHDQPAPPMGEVFLFDEALCGESRLAKCEALCAALETAGAQGSVITKPDSIAWLLNIRGRDLDYMPVTLSTLVIDAVNRHMHWFVDFKKIPERVRDILQPLVKIHMPDDLDALLLTLDYDSFALDPMHAPDYYRQHLERQEKRVIALKDPCIEAKACKHALEHAALVKAHVIDGAAVSRVLAWLDDANASGEISAYSEMDVAAKLHEMRGLNPAYYGESFPAITGVGANGAVVHYRATPSTNSKLQGNTVLLIDSGGQYYDPEQHCAGTTDITRTVVIGDADRIDEEVKQAFTLVLKGHIALASAVFKAGTTGVQLDALARAPLQQEGLDYAHGTGHGVGCFGDVHEEAASLSPRGKEAPRPGMLLSNEPGYYKAGAYGIRTENLVFVRKMPHGHGLGDGDDDTLHFETVTLAPIDRRLILPDLLTDSQRAWLNAYHARVYETLSPALDDKTQAWLQQATLPV